MGTVARGILRAVPFMQLRPRASGWQQTGLGSCPEQTAGSSSRGPRSVGMAMAPSRKPARRKNLIFCFGCADKCIGVETTRWIHVSSFTNKDGGWPGDFK